ncbi:MAG: translational GTPase TypA, partial [Desulfovibrionaceae bacterium]|nr:translational GTPase TypA [Desulfovibrionaceae bacterium]
MQRNDIRNVAIIAHVDHGKTTLLDRLLEQTGALGSFKAEEERIMDSNPLERERGITILSKNTSLVHKGVRINIVDTPGHADFGGEVERVLNMVDGVLLLVDAFDGPMPQTKFVLGKALALGLMPLVVVNKIDRPDARPWDVLDMIFDLFVSLGASDRQLDFPYLFASAKAGYAVLDPKDAERTEGMGLLLDMILERLPAPEVEPDRPFQMLVANLFYDNYLGRLLVGRISRGRIAAGDRAVRIGRDNARTLGKINTIFAFTGLTRQSVGRASAGDIVMIAGIPEGFIGETLADPEHPDALPVISVDEPTVSMHFRINDGPLSGEEGKYVTSRHLRERLERELLSNIAMRLEETETTDEFKVSGRGELHLSILIETMRREGYEFTVSRPKVIFRQINGRLCEPVEDLCLEAPEGCVGALMELLGRRRAEVQGIDKLNADTVRVRAHIPTRGLTGLRSEVLSITKGEGIMTSALLGFEPYKGDSSPRTHGVMIAKEPGESVPYAMWKLEDRGYFIIKPNTRVYEGMIVGAHAKPNDIVVNVCATKKLTNIRAANKDEAVRLTPPRTLDLEQSLHFMADDELMEVTPKAIRL